MASLRPVDSVMGVGRISGQLSNHLRGGVRKGVLHSPFCFLGGGVDSKMGVVLTYRRMPKSSS